MKSAAAAPPRKLALSLTNRCTTHCEFCYRRENGLEPAYFPLERYKELVRELASSLQCVEFGGIGEPLLHRQFEKFAVHARRTLHHTARLRLVTSGDLLTENVARFLIEVGFFSVWVSLNAASGQTRLSVMPGSDLDAVCSSIERLVRLREETRLRMPLVRVSFVVTRNNYLELEAFLDLACELGVDMVGIHALNKALNSEIYRDQVAPISELTPILERVRRRALVDGRIQCAPLWAFYPSMRSLHLGTYTVICKSPEQILEIFFTTGEVTFCPYMAAEIETYSLGNVYEQDALEIWNGDKARAFRRPMEVPAIVPQVCRDCLCTRNKQVVKV